MLVKIGKINTTFLRSRVGRRIFTLFVLCALIPIAALAIVSFSHVTQQLSEQSRKRLHQASKTVGLGIYDRLLFLEAGMDMLSARYRERGGTSSEISPDAFSGDFKRRFKGLAVVSDGHALPLLGRVRNLPELSPAEQRHIGSGKTLLSVQRRPNLPARILVIRAIDPRRPSRGILLGEIRDSYLWGLGRNRRLPPMTRLWVLDRWDNVLISPLPNQSSLPEGLGLKITGSAAGQFEWRQDGKEYLGSYWSIPLKFRFFVPPWKIILTQSKDDVLAPMNQFRKIFPLVILLSLWVVLLLSISQIRRNLDPLEKLQEGTRRIALGDFGNRVAVKSGDEFEELAASFNDMAARLGRQFSALNVLRDVNLAVTSTLDLQVVLGMLLDKINLLLPYSALLLRLTNRKDGGMEQVVGRNLDADQWRERLREGRPPLLKEVMDSSTPVVIGNIQADGRAPDPEFFRRYGLVSYLGIPMTAKGQTLGFLSFLTTERHDFDREEIEYLSTLTREAAMAIYNSQLYEDIKNQAVELERANRVKSEFLSVMSHELRTPLNVIMGTTSMMLEGMLGDINEKQVNALGRVVGQSTDLLTMFDRIMEVTMIEVGAIKVATSPIRLNEFLNEMRSLYSYPLGKDITLRWEYPSDLPLIKVDGGKLKHILQNLVNNAIKFTPRGAVTVSVRCVAATETLELRVADTGIGIPEESLPIIFERFRQVDSTDRRLYGGVGLGLYIVKKFTEMLGGQVRVESVRGEGSVFTVTLPVILP